MRRTLGRTILGMLLAVGVAAVLLAVLWVLTGWMV